MTIIEELFPDKDICDVLIYDNLTLLNAHESHYS